VLATPHLGYGTWATFDAFFAEAFAQVNAFAAGAPTGVVNPEVLDARRAAGGPGTRETG
jgi:D-3-phosphoglycerate dehydrogenase / 2-oxoglutarate reductase